MANCSPMHCGDPMVRLHQTSAVSSGPPAIAVFSSVWMCGECGVRLAVPEQYVRVRASNGKVVRQ